MATTNPLQNKQQQNSQIVINHSGPPVIIACRVCGSQQNLRRCSNCKVAYYCSQPHQQTDWRNHRAECKSIKNTTDNNNASKLVLVNQAAAAGHSNEMNGAANNPAWTANGVGGGETNNGIPSSAAWPGEGSSERSILIDKAEAVTSTSSVQTKKPQDFRNLSSNAIVINDINLSNPNVLSR